MSGLRSLHTMNLFSRFFQENQEKFLAFAYSYLRDKAEAEDVVMESMIALWENRDRWVGPLVVGYYYFPTNNFL